MKSTLFCMHVMPNEIEMLERFMAHYRRALTYLNGDNFTMKVSLNLNPELTDWEASELKQDYFITRFSLLFNGIKNINEIILDNSLWGTTQQKRESIELNYDQFIFCDADILLHEHQLKHQLTTSYQLDGMYIISPSIPRWWDNTWDIITHSALLDKETGYAHSQEAVDNAYTQTYDKLYVRKLPILKFGCGMHTLYSKSFWKFVGIPKEFGGYGPEDTYGMTAGSMAKTAGYQIEQYVMDGLYITEDYINREPSFSGKIKQINKKTEFYKSAESTARDCLIRFATELNKKQSNP